MKREWIDWVTAALIVVGLVWFVSDPTLHAQAQEPPKPPAVASGSNTLTAKEAEAVMLKQPSPDKPASADLVQAITQLQNRISIIGVSLAILQKEVDGARAELDRVVAQNTPEGMMLVPRCKEGKSQKGEDGRETCAPSDVVWVFTPRPQK